MTLGDRARAALAQAAGFRLLALAFERPRPDWRRELAALAAEVDDHALRGIAGLAGGADEGAYHALVGAGGPVSARAVAHRLDDPGRLLADIALAHEAFGYRPRRAEEPIDHLAVEIDFVAYLWLKEAWAAANGDDRAAAAAELGRARFCARHLGPLARRFGGRLGGGGPPYLVAACAALLARLPAGDEPADAVPPPGLGPADCAGCSFDGECR
jgi:hypothetical protein